MNCCRPSGTVFSAVLWVFEPGAFREGSLCFLDAILFLTTRFHSAFMSISDLVKVLRRIWRASFHISLAPHISILLSITIDYLRYSYSN